MVETVDELVVPVVVGAVIVWEDKDSSLAVNKAVGLLAVEVVIGGMEVAKESVVEEEVCFVVIDEETATSGFVVIIVVGSVVLVIVDGGNSEVDVVVDVRQEDVVASVVVDLIVMVAEGMVVMAVVIDVVAE